MLMLQPQVQWTSLAAAQAEDPRGLSVGSTVNKLEYVYHARITYVTGASNTTTGKVSISGVSYITGTRASQVSVAGYVTPTAAGVSVAATPTNYVAATPDVEAHLVGIDTELAAISTLDAVTASETLAAGDMVNLYTVTGALRVQKADGSGTTKPINGYVRAAITSGTTGTVYSLGIVSGLTGLTPGGDCWLSQATAGAVTQTAPNEATTGKTIQMAGKAVSASTMLFQPGPPVLT